MDQTVATILNAANNAAQNATDEEQRFTTVVRRTRELFRPHRRSEPTPRKKNTFKRKVFLMKLAHADFFPAPCEQSYLNKRGLGKANNIAIINRTWTLEKLKSELTKLFPNNIRVLLTMCDFDLAKCQKSKKLMKLPNIQNAGEVEETLGHGVLILIPKRDFPSDLPPIEETLRIIVDSDSEAEFERPSVRPRLDLEPSTSEGSTLRPRPEERHRIRLRSPVPSISSQERLPPVLTQTRSDSPPLEMNSENIYETVMNNNDAAIEFITLGEDAPKFLLNIDRQEDIIKKMLELYKNEELLVTHSLNVQFTGEMGIDGGGLTKELFTMFWEKIFSSPYHFKGHDVVLPYLPLHLWKQKPDFKILGQIFSHTIISTRAIPPKLAKITYFIFGNKNLDFYVKNCLLKEFLWYLTLPERVLVQKGMKNFKNLTSKEIDRLTSLFTSNSFYDIPKEDQFQDQVLLIAEKIFIKDTADLYEEMQNGLSLEVRNFFCNLTCDQISHLWNKTRPTRERVMDCLVMENLYCTNEQEKTYFYLQNFVGSLSDKDLQRFLLFVTGSVSMPEKITVGFHDYKGMDRRPIAHTCTCELDLATNYDTQQEFNYEFNLFLADDASFEYSSV